MFPEHPLTHGRWQMAKAGTVSDAFYRLVRCMGRPAFARSSRPVLLHADRVPATGPVIVAANHLSPYDIPCLMGAIDRPLDFVSVVEMFRNPLVAWFFRNMNAFPLDRGRVDAGTTRIILDRLRRGRAVAMFPEGRIRQPGESMLVGGPVRLSVIRLARLAGSPIVPGVMLGTGVFSRASAWKPVGKTKYGAAFGYPIVVNGDQDEAAACAAAEMELMAAYRDLYAELSAASGLTVADQPWRPAGVNSSMTSG